MKRYITTELINSVYALHKKGVDDDTISSVLSVSITSVKRINELMTAAENGDVENLANMYGRGNRWRMKEKVCEIYGIDPNRIWQAEPEKEVTTEETATEEATPEEQPAPTNTDATLDEIAGLLRRQCALLERLCTAWGV